MDELRTQLERRQATLRSLSHPSSVLGSVLAFGTPLESPTEPWTAAERRFKALLSRLVRFRRAQCYANAQQAVLLTSRLGAVASRHSLEYWEGFAHLPMPAPFAHGWCVLNGRVWDPSLAHLGIGVRYLGLRIPVGFIREGLDDRRTYAPLLPQWVDRLNGVHRTPVEQTGRAISLFDPRRRLAGAPTRG